MDRTLTHARGRRSPHWPQPFGQCQASHHTYNTVQHSSKEALLMPLSHTKVSCSKAYWTPKVFLPPSCQFVQGTWMIHWLKRFAATVVKQLLVQYTFGRRYIQYKSVPIACRCAFLFDTEHIDQQQKHLRTNRRGSSHIAL